MAPLLTDTVAQRRFTTALLILVLGVLALISFNLLTGGKVHIGGDGVDMERKQVIEDDLHYVENGLRKEISSLRTQLDNAHDDNVELKDSLNLLIYQKQQLLIATDAVIATLESITTQTDEQAGHTLQKAEAFLSFRRNEDLHHWDPNAESTYQLQQLAVQQSTKILLANAAIDSLIRSNDTLQRDLVRARLIINNINAHVLELEAHITALAEDSVTNKEQLARLQVEYEVGQIELTTARGQVNKWRKFSVINTRFAPEPVTLAPDRKGIYSARKIKGLSTTFQFVHNDVGDSRPRSFKLVYSIPVEGDTVHIPRAYPNVEPGRSITDVPETQNHKFPAGFYTVDIYDAEDKETPLQRLTFRATR